MYSMNVTPRQYYLTLVIHSMSVTHRKILSYLRDVLDECDTQIMLSYLSDVLDECDTDNVR